MDAENVRGLIRQLIESTQIGKLAWQETADEDTFRLLLNAGIIHIQRIKMQRMGGSLGESQFKLVFLNENNTPVEEFEGGGYPNDQEQLRNLYEGARGSALKPSNLLQAIQKEVIQRSA